MIRKQYPYLQEQYIYNLNEEQEKRDFLVQLDNFVNQRQYVQITLLDWDENILKEIQGEITGGSISKDGASSVRRTARLSCSVSKNEYSLESLNMDFSLNKKIFIEVGIKNETDQYQDWPILWFPQGLFIITDFSLNSSTTSAINLNLALKDEMCLLNGDVGGKLPASVQFDIMDTQLPDGQWTQQKILVYDIILELVNHYGGVPISNIIIQDVPLRIKQVVKWNGKNKIYMKSTSSDTGFSIYTFNLNNFDGAEEKYTGEDIGYVYRDFVYNDELVGAAGASITSILDTIKNYLGNYEYFFNEFGIFIFREIKNYLNITQAQTILEEMSNPGKHIKFAGGNFLLDANSEKQYLIETTNEKTCYAFNDDSNITSITVTPQYGNIKNDYIIEGLREGTSSNVKHSVRYHLAIDEKPQVIGTDSKGDYYGVHENVVFYTDTSIEDSSIRINKLGVIPDKEPYTVEDFNLLPNIGNLDALYYVSKDKKSYFWNGTVYKELILITTDTNGKEIQNSVQPRTYYSRDWRTFLYIYGLNANANGTDSGYYFSELDAFWPQEYDLTPDNQHFFGEDESDNASITYTLSTGNFFLDFIDANSSSLGEYSVNAIGRRQDVVSDDKVNCLFTPEIPDVIFLNIDNPKDNWTENTASITTEDQLNEIYQELVGGNASKKTSETKYLEIQREECKINAQSYTQVHEDIFSNLAIGGYSNSAYEAIRYELFVHSRYQNSISITSIPIFYLDANSRVELNSKSTNLYGDYMVQNITLTLGPGANMAVVLNEVAERL